MRALAKKEEAPFGASSLLSLVSSNALEVWSYHSLEAGQPPVAPTHVRSTAPLASFLILNVSPVAAAVAVTSYPLPASISVAALRYALPFPAAVWIVGSIAASSAAVLNLYSPRASIADVSAVV